jgi:hypothetical protein
MIGVVDGQPLKFRGPHHHAVPVHVQSQLQLVVVHTFSTLVISGWTVYSSHGFRPQARSEKNVLSI